MSEGRERVRGRLGWTCCLEDAAEKQEEGEGEWMVAVSQKELRAMLAKDLERGKGQKGSNEEEEEQKEDG